MSYFGTYSLTLSEEEVAWIAISQKLHCTLQPQHERNATMLGVVPLSVTWVCVKQGHGPTKRAESLFPVFFFKRGTEPHPPEKRFMFLFGTSKGGDRSGNHSELINFRFGKSSDPCPKLCSRLVHQPTRGHNRNPHTSWAQLWRSPEMGSGSKPMGSHSVHSILEPILVGLVDVHWGKWEVIWSRNRPEAPGPLRAPKALG